MRVAMLTTSWPTGEQDPAGHFVRTHARELERGGDTVTVVAPEPGVLSAGLGAAARIREEARARAGGRSLGAEGSQARPGARRRSDRGPLGRPLRLAHRDRDAPADRRDLTWGRCTFAHPSAGSRFAERSCSFLSARVDAWCFVSASLLEDLLASLDSQTRTRLQKVARVEALAIEMPDVTSAIADLRRELGARRIAVSVGRLVQSKRVDRSVEYVSQSKEIDRLVVVGDGPERSRLERLARRLGVDASFTGALGRPRALAWIGAADLLIVASEAEGLSTVIREADALGTRVVRI